MGAVTSASERARLLPSPAYSGSGNPGEIIRTKTRNGAADYTVLVVICDVFGLVLAPVVDSAIEVVQVLSDEEQMECFTAVIETGWSNFVQVGVALARSRDLPLYRVEFQGFDTCCRENG